eukprot:7142882-Prymnesium_polylepis.1
MCIRDRRTPGCLRPASRRGASRSEAPRAAASCPARRAQSAGRPNHVGERPRRTAHLSCRQA